jgi:hypothetical protein
MIPVKCHTNVDAGRTKEWPISLWTKPNLGEIIKSKSGLLSLQIIEIVHTENGLEIELGLTDLQREILRNGGRI